MKQYIEAGLALATLATIVTLSACASTDVQASGMEGNTGLSLVGGAGPAMFNSSTGDSSNFSGDVDEEDIAINLGGAYRFDPRWSGELTYTDFGELTFDGLYMGTPSEGTVTATAIEATAVYHHPIDEGWEAIGMAGLVLWDAEEEELFGGAPDDDDDSGTSLKAGLGVQTSVTDNFLVRLTYEHYFDIWDDTIDVVMLRGLWTP